LFTHSHCHPKDNYVKQEGRILASGRDAQRVPLRYLGGILSQIAEEVEVATGLPTEDTDYHREMRYFLPTV